MRDGGLDDQQRAEEADQDDRQQRDANDRERRPVARPTAARPVGGQRQPDSHQHRDGGHIGARRGGEANFALSEHHRGELEKKSK